MPNGSLGRPRPAEDNTIGLHFYYDAEVLSLRSITKKIKQNIEKELDLGEGTAFDVNSVGVGISSSTSTFNVFLKLESDFSSREITLDGIHEIENDTRDIIEEITDVELVTITISPT